MGKAIVYRIVSSFGIMVLAVTVIGACPIQAQDSGVSGMQQRAPRFLLETRSGSVPIDVDRTPSLQQRVAMELDGATLKQALDMISARSGLHLVYSDDIVPLQTRVHLKAEEIAVGAALTDVLMGTGLDVIFTTDGRATLVQRATLDTPPVRVISGHVTDSISRTPVQVGQVGIAGASNTAEIRGGIFRISAPGGAVTLTIRSLGYIQKSVSVAAEQDSVNIVMTRNNFHLQEVVVTGQASGVERKNLANAVTVVNAPDLSRVPEPTIERALQGQVPGAHISANSGAPGGGSIVRMRGVTSINGAFTPLYVVDGVIVSDVNLGTGTNAVIGANGTSLNPSSGNEDNGDNRIADINTYDIESVEVLKGASASAIYGSKAANGVIIITTKKGKEGASQFDITQRFGFSKLDHEFGHRCFTLAEAVATFGPTAASNYTPTCHDFEQELYGGTPGSYETAISGRGSIQSTEYFVSLLNSRDGGIVPNTDAGKQSVRINIEQPFASRIHLSLGVNTIHTVRDPGVTQNGNNGTPIGGSIAYGGATWLDLRQQQNGVYPVNPYASSNPFQTVALFQNHESVWRNILSEQVTVDLFTSARQTLRFVSTGGADMFTQKNNVLAPPELYSEQFLALPGSSVLGYGQSENTNINANLVHTLNVGTNSKATTQIGVQSEKQALDLSATMASGLTGDLSNINEGLAVSVQEARQRVHDLGLFAQEEFLTLDQRLLLTLGGRADQSSNNGNPNQLYFYPKASVSYQIPGLPSLIEQLKLRAALGFSGNEPLYGQKFTELVPGNIGGSVPILTIQGNAGAADLRPERQREIETGIDATFLHSRVNVEATVYEKSVSDLLLQQTLAPTTGLSSLYFNGGALRNRGLELTGTVIPVERASLTWRTTGTFALNRCTVLSLPVPAFRPATTINSSTFGYTFIQPGKSCTQIYGRDTLGAEPGDAKLGTPGTAITRALTDANPKYNASWSNAVDYKRLHLNFLLDEQKGGVMANITEYEYDATGDSPDYLVPRKPGALTGQQRFAAFAKTSRPYLQDVSYLKLREVTLGLDLPDAFVRNVWGGLHSARLELSGRNLLTITPYHSTADPEANQIARSAAQGVPWDIWSYPPSRSFFFTIHLGM
jgi:TonB-linked SusC/RagA family outer membrane protein